MTTTMDFKAKRQELLNLWERMFGLCRGMVESAELGEQVLKASMVKELNQFLRLSAEILDKAEQEAQQDAITAAFEDPIDCDDEYDEDDVLPFPIRDLPPLET